MRIVVVGAGAVGSYFGAKLARVGNEVVFIGRGDHQDRMRRFGLLVSSIDGDFQIFAPTAPSPENLGLCDLVLFTVKDYDAEAAARQLEPLLGADTTILPLQNGVESEEKLIRLYGEEKVVGGLCYVGAAIQRAGEVIHSAAGRIILGELDGRTTIRIAQLANLFEEADVPVKVSSDIMADKWRKLAWNVSFNPVSALTGKTVGRILEVGESREIIRQAIAETVLVAKAEGIALEDDLPQRIISDNEQYHNLKTSMLRDVERGGRLEFEALNGVVVRRGAAHSIPVPVNNFLYSLTKCIDPTVKG